MLRPALAAIVSGILVASISAQPGGPKQLLGWQGSSDSTVKIKGLNVLAITPKGTVYVAGYNTKFSNHRVTASAFFWRLTNRVVKVFRFPACGQIDGMQWRSETSGWVISAGCGVFSTVDGGVSWRKLSFSEKVGGSPFFLDSQTAWYFNRNEELVSYRDGQSERLSKSEGFRIIKRLAFVDPNNGWQLAVVDGRSQLLMTSDGGRNWASSPLPNVADAVDFQIADPTRFFAITPHALYSKSNLDAQWRKVRETGEGDWFDRMFVSHEHVWTQGRVMCRSRLDGTKSVCSAMPERILNENIKSFIFRGGLNGWILTDEGLYRSDDGSSWHRQMLNFGKVRF